MKERRNGDARPVVIVTGGSRGIGRATAEHLASTGWRVFATARTTPADSTPPDPSGEAHQTGELTRLLADVRETDHLRRAVSDALTLTGGRLDAVIANAGIAAVGTFEDTPAEVMASLMETNYFGVLNTVRETLPALRASHGRIVVISSDAAIYGTPGLSGYSASKFALEGWSESVAHELRPCGISLSIVRPGAFRTDIWQSEIYLPDDGLRLRLAERVIAKWTSTAETAADPKRVAATVEKVLTAKHPKLRYTVGRDARRAAVLRRTLPDNLFVRFVERGNKLRTTDLTTKSVDE